MVLYLDTFHILTADIQDTVHLRVKESGCIVVGYGLHFPLIQKKGRLDQCLSVAGGTGVCDFGFPGKVAVNFLNGTDTGCQGIAVVVAVKGVEQGTIFPDQGCLCCGGACVYTKIAVSAVAGEFVGFHIVMTLALIEFVIIRPGGKQRFHTVDLKFHMYIG